MPEVMAAQVMMAVYVIQNQISNADIIL